MSKNESIIHYLVASLIFKKWLDAGIINEAEFIKINALLAAKYGIPFGSIYR